MTECALKQALRSKGYLLQKEGNGYMLTDLIADRVLLGAYPNEYGATLQQVENFHSKLG